jgi:hypothetical protein
MTATVRHRAVAAVAIATMLLLPGIAAGQASPVDLVTELTAALSANGADVVWDALPDATTQADPGDDQFTIDAGTPKDPAASGDLVQGDQFGFGYPAPARRDLFGPGGALACDATGVACPAYDTTTGPFAKGVIVVGFQLAAPATVQGPELLTIAVHAADDDYPTAVDPRPGSVFPGTNQLWRLDLSAQGAAVRYLQLAGGTFQEFHTDARVLVDGDHGWFFIPQSEYRLAHTVVGWDLEAYWLPSADSPANRQAIDNLGKLTPRRLLVPAGATGRLAQAAPSPSASASPVASPVASPSGAPSTPAPGTTSGGAPVWVWVVVIAFGGGLLVIAFRLWSSGAPAPGSPTTTGENAPPPIIMMEKRRVRRQRRIRVEVETEGRMIYSDESRYETITITETVEEEVPVDAPVAPDPVAPEPETPEPVAPKPVEPEPPGPVVPAPPVVVAEPVAPVTPCVEEFEAWQAAEARCRAASQAAEQAESRARDARAELDALRQEYPPLGFDQADTTVIEMSDGMRMSDLDRALMDWDAANRPQPPRTSDPHEQLRRNKERLDRVRQEYAGFKAREAELIAKVAEAEAAAREAEVAAKAACDLAAEAKAAYERCMGIARGAEEPKPEQPKPEQPKPEQPKPEQPKPEQPKPTPGSAGQGGEEPASGGCEEGDERREVLGRLDDLEFLPSGASVKVTVTSTRASVGLEEEGGYPDAVQAAAAWASQRDRDLSTRNLSFDLTIETQVRRVTMECARWLRCTGGRWVEVVQHAETVSDEIRVLTIQRENLGIKELRQAITLTASRLRPLDSNRSRFESFCR